MGDEEEHNETYHEKRNAVTKRMVYRDMQRGGVGRMAKDRKVIPDPIDDRKFQE